MVKTYEKPKIKLGEMLMLMEEDYDLLEVLNAAGKQEFSGDLGEIRHNDTDHYNRLKERLVDHFTFNDYEEHVIWLED